MICVMFLTDGRLVAAGKKLAAAGYQVIGAATLYEAKRIVQTGASQIDCVVLPIRGTDDGTIAFENGKADIAPLLKGLKPGTPVFTGRRTDYLLSLGLDLHNCFENEAVALANAPLTAEGVLWMLLEKTPRSLADYTYDVLGLGKTGRSIRALLNRLGLTVRSVTRGGLDSSLPLSAWAQSPPSDVVIVTIPAPVLTQSVVAQWRRPVTVIDITSGQAGVEADALSAPNLIYFSAPPLPGIVAPESAGDLIADFIIDTLGGM